METFQEPETSSDKPNTGTQATFDSFGVDEEIQAAVAKLGWTNPTPVQQLCLPHTIAGKDVAGFAQTGTGKTGVFLISIASQIKKAQDKDGPQAIVLVPTRELAVQIEMDAKPIFEPLGIKSLAVFGGVDYEKQASKLRAGIDVIVATPGRLKDYCQKKVVDLQKISVFVCDEADRMFDMGFIDDVEFFLGKIPENSQKLLFSATTNDQVKELAFEYLESPEYISVNPEVITPEAIEQNAVHCPAIAKVRVMLGFFRDHEPECAIIFTNTKLVADWLHYKLTNNGINADLITGDLPQKKRIRLIQKIKDGQIKALIATDVASRGLHISRVSHVYNFDLPDDPANYVHRIGRTARAGAKGKAFSLVCDDYGHNLQGINELLGEHPLSSIWFEESYMQIEDKAGDPFGDENWKSSRNDSDGDRGRGKPGRDRDGAGRDGRSRDAKGRDGKGRDRNKDRDNNRKGAQAKDRNDRGRSDKPGNKGGKKSRNRNNDKRSDRNKASAKPETTQVDKPKTPESTGGLVKKLFKTLFGKK